MPFHMTARIVQSAVFAKAANACLKQAAFLLRRIPAGFQNSDRFPLPNGRALLRAVIPVHHIHQPIHQGLHGRRAAPDIDRCGQRQQVTGVDRLKQRLPVIILYTAEHGPVFLAIATGHTGTDLPVIQPERFHFCARFLQFLAERSQNCRCISVFSGTSPQNANSHPFPSRTVLILLFPMIRTPKFACQRTRK